MTRTLFTGLIAVAVIVGALYLLDPTLGGFLRKEGFQNAVINGPSATGQASAGQMSNPGNVNVVNTIGNQHAVAGNLRAKEGFSDLAGYEGPAQFGNAEAPAGCYPRDQLVPSELLPKDPNSVWAQQSSIGSGSLAGKNFLSGGALIGVNTVGESLKNANYQLRSEPPNPQVPVSVFNNSTITPDINRRPLEIA